MGEEWGGYAKANLQGGRLPLALALEANLTRKQRIYHEPGEQTFTVFRQFRESSLGSERKWK